MDLIEDYCGASLTHSAVRIVGVPLDLPSNWIDDCVSFLDVLEQELVILNCKLESKKLGYDAEKVCKIDIRVDYGLEGKLKALEVEEQLNEMYNKINMYKENIEELKKKGAKT